mgnify:CR=1 FL=1
MALVARAYPLLWVITLVPSSVYFHKDQYDDNDVESFSEIYGYISNNIIIVMKEFVNSQFDELLKKYIEVFENE